MNIMPDLLKKTKGRVGEIVDSWRDYPDRNDRFSHSALNTFVNICPLQHRFSYIERRKAKTKGPYLAFGSAMDEVWKTFHDTRAKKEVPKRSDLLTTFAKVWAKESRDPLIDWSKKGTREDWAEKGPKVIDKMLDSEPDLEVLDTSVHFVVPIIYSDGTKASERYLCGQMDMVAGVKGKRVIVVDLKTSGSRPPQEKLNQDFQSWVYCYALYCLFPQLRDPDKLSFRYHYYITTKAIQFHAFDVNPWTAQFDRICHIVRVMEAQSESGLVIPRRTGNFFCDGCGYQQACDDWTPTIPMIGETTNDDLS